MISEFSSIFCLFLKIAQVSKLPKGRKGEDIARFDSVEKDTRKAKEGSRSGQTRRFLRRAPTRPDRRNKRASSIKLMTEQATVTLDALFLFSIKISKTEFFQARLNSEKKSFKILPFFLLQYSIFAKS